MENLYHATPYDLSATGFYFKTYEDYTSQATTHRNEYGDEVEEYEIQFIDGGNCELFSVLSVNQANLKQWFDEFEDLDGEDLIKAIYLASDLNYDIDDILATLTMFICLKEQPKNMPMTIWKAQAFYLKFLRIYAFILM